ncbi:MAG: hypothetical protein FWF56_06055 [Firmicutes bacterium]|nr:hypothetical protein [Bacillota bacterium]MCL1953461.1 hypothetical protein [Bacillota bacterium]
MSNIGSLNLSRAITFNLVFDGYESKRALQAENEQGDGINQSIVMTIARGQDRF